MSHQLSNLVTILWCRYYYYWVGQKVHSSISKHLTEKHKRIFWPTQYFIDNETEAQWGCLTCLGLQSYIVMELGSNPGVILQVRGSQQGVVLFPRYYLSMSGDVFLLSQLEGRCWWHLVGRNATKLPTMQKTAPQQRIIWPKMSTVPRLRNLAVQLQLLATVKVLEKPPLTQGLKEDNYVEHASNRQL